MSDERPPPDDWLTGDPFADPEDPAARERAERRAEREQKRREKAAKDAGQPPPPPPDAAPAGPPKAKRTPEQEFWNEDPTPEPEQPAAPPPKEPEAPPPKQPEAPPEQPEPSPAAAERSAEERARPAGNVGRTEKQARREPEPPPPAAPPPPPEPPTQDRAPEPPTEDRAPEPPSAGPLPPEPPTEDRAPEPPTQDPAPEPVPVGADPTRPATGEHLVPDPGAPSARGQTSEEWAAVPAARADALDEAFHDEGNPEMAGAARSGRRSGDGGRRGGFLGTLTRHPFRIAAVVVVLIVLWFLNGLFEPFHGDGHGRVAVRIPKGASVSEVGDILERRGVIGGPGLIDASTLFQIRVTLAGKRSDLYAGKFTLQKEMSYGDAINALSKEPSAQKPGVRTVTIPEGYTRAQAAKLVREDGVPGKYMKATVNSKLLDPAEYGGKQAKNLEGFLFPNTFELRPKAPVKKLVALQLQDFKQKIKKVNMKYAKSKNLTVYDVVTIASMIEDEAGVAKQRKLVGSVIYNRLREGIPLGIDATIRFATGNYERPLTVSELETDSPYNTRLNAGLPPGPINSPGLASLRAAAHPAGTEFIYYVNDPDSCNELTFAKTDAEFEAAVQKYEKAREANGGNAPSTCGE